MFFTNVDPSKKVYKFTYTKQKSGTYRKYKHFVLLDASESLSDEEQDILRNLLKSFPHAADDEWPEKFRAVQCIDISPRLLKLAANAYDEYGNTMLGVVAEYGKDLDAVKKLDRLKANLNTADNRGKLPLHWAINCRTNHRKKATAQGLDILEYLLARGADPNLTLKYVKNTPLQYAISEGCTGAVLIIERHLETMQQSVVFR